VIKQENIVDFTASEGLADRVARKFGASMTQSMFKGMGLH